MKKIVLSFILLLVATTTILAQTFSVTSSMDSTILLVGEQTKMTFEVCQPAGTTVNMPIFSDTIVPGLEIVERLPLDTQKLDNGGLVVRQSYLLTSFDSALYYIDALPFVVGQDTQYSEPMSLKVLTVPVDTAQHAIADIKPVYAPPFDWPLFWTIVIIVLCVVLLAVGGYFLYRYLKRRTKAKTEEEQEPQDLRPAHVIALERLESIKNEKLWQQNRAKEYYTQLTDVLRDYIDRRYHVSAVEQTSAEILSQMQPLLKTQKDVYAVLKDILSTADLVKFAKYKTIINEDEQALASAYQFVDATKEDEAISANDVTKEQSSK